ncbi:MAG: stage 0 sporulation protein [Elusimicrobia bacterium]|nr:stage 0 sporulation protein [Elusimicrobiota bacterium]MBD3412000.1 stage 0 sporulation protein [Elusimicrobiota bacterium]
MPIVVGIALRKIKEHVFADAGHYDLHLDDRVIIETDNGLEMGTVIEPERMVEKPKTEIYKVIRKAQTDDVKRVSENRVKACHSIPKIKQCITNHELDMKLTHVEYSFDRSKLFIYYTAEFRVDFRELIKDLGHILKTRIQMVQIGVRDEARMIGGLGQCGRPLCCQSFLREFSPVSIDMAKEQDISLNTAKISGSCGRLMCCLAYEEKYYSEVKKMLPPIKSTVKTPEGTGMVVGMNCITRELIVDLGEGKHIRIEGRLVQKAHAHNHKKPSSSQKSNGR